MQTAKSSRFLYEKFHEFTYVKHFHLPINLMKAQGQHYAWNYAVTFWLSSLREAQLGGPCCLVTAV